MSETRRLAISSSIRPSTIYTSSPLSRDNPKSSSSRPLSTYSTFSSRQENSKLSSQSSSRPSTIYISANVSQSFKVVRRQRQRKPSRRGTHNVLNQTLDNFYNTLRRTKTYQTVKSAKNWVNEYESYRNSVILEEKEYENYRFSMIMSSNENENDYDYENYENWNDFEQQDVNVNNNNNRHRRYDDENNSSSISPVTKTTRRQSRLSPLSATTTSDREEQIINRYQNSLNNHQNHKVTEPLYSNYF